MNTFANNIAMGNTFTTNGMYAYESTGNELVDLFGGIGSARNNDGIVEMYLNAFNVDRPTATKILFWARDIRGGAGERDTFRKILLKLEQVAPAVVIENLHNVPYYGRWDDLLIFNNRLIRDHAFSLISTTILEQRDGWQLACKWMPRQGAVANELRKWFKLTPKQYRKLLVHGSNTVEQKMCAKDFASINYEQVPSVAALRYSKSFNRNDEVRYGEYRAALARGEAKINSAALFPHNITQRVKSTRGEMDDVLNAQWKALPDFMVDANERILPMIDVSGSMSCPVGNNPKLDCMDVSVGLGMYVAMKQPGDFNGVYLTFEETPILEKIDTADGVCNAVRRVYNSSWGGNTNLEAALKKILDYAICHKVLQEEMPTMLMILSDMQFDAYGNKTSTGLVETLYKRAGYFVPKIVWWNLNDAYGNTPVGAMSNNMFYVSGFSPAILKSIVNSEELPPVPTPYDLMMAVIGSDRYDRVIV